ncbi:aminoglycoside phosphotransferase family protein [Acinetobacter nectaris]|uniref:aminoglycoside phosphotransferase family protein n=1 Tax=Acinetobacter nectaris TaxID=1219382 RepID=UPI001F1D0C24|nr:phosphotransferase [Acinetobacter nectaris]MCF9035272.1 phosphotransferase [Acinetobacter nectaris]
MNKKRERLIKDWLTSVLRSDQFEINYLAGDASFRRYARVIYDNKTFMLMDAPPDKEDCVPFVSVAEFLYKNNVRVPIIEAKHLENGLLLLEDFGDVVLAQQLNASTVDQYYQQCFEQLIQLQASSTLNVIPNYSYEKLVAEMNLFVEWFLPSLEIMPTDQQKQDIQNTFHLLASNAIAQPQVFVHRDFHSRNLMKLATGKELGVIDFQDAVVGADTYDLMSLIRDAYVQWPQAQVEMWITQFYNLLPKNTQAGRSLEEFHKDADFMSLQRHIKILGIFVRLFKRDGKQGYLKDLPRVMWYVLNESQKYPELEAFYQFLKNQVMPKFNQVYGVYLEV